LFFDLIALVTATEPRSGFQTSIIMRDGQRSGGDLTPLQKKQVGLAKRAKREEEAASLARMEENFRADNLRYQAEYQAQQAQALALAQAQAQEAQARLQAHAQAQIAVQGRPGASERARQRGLPSPAAPPAGGGRREVNLSEEPSSSDNSGAEDVGPAAPAFAPYQLLVQDGAPADEVGNIALYPLMPFPSGGGSARRRQVQRRGAIGEWARSWGALTRDAD
jgi:hypothetical protein